MSFFKMPKPAWKLTDEEYVERVRIAHRRYRSWQKVVRLAWLLILMAAFVITWKVVGIALDHPAGPDKAPVFQAYVMGGLAGWLMGYTLLKAVFLNAESWTMERAYRIMLDCWDRAKQLEQSGEPSRNSKLKAPQP
jgi:uncharacterized membrane protein